MLDQTRGPRHAWSGKWVGCKGGRANNAVTVGTFTTGC
jgi:hypothetical protein